MLSNMYINVFINWPLDSQTYDMLYQPDCSKSKIKKYNYGYVKID